MKILDLFSGIGGFSLAGRWANMETVQFVEIDPFCRRVLEKTFKECRFTMTLSLFEESDFEGLTCLQEAFPVSPTVSQGSDKARQMTALFGERCLELSKNPSRVGLLARTLLTSLTWGSTICYMTWKRQATKQGHLLYRLAPSTPRINETGFGGCQRPKNRRDISRTQSGTDKRDILRQEPEDGNPIRLHNNGGGSTPPNSESIKRERFKREGDTGGEPKEQVRGKFWVGEHWQNIEPCIRRGDNGVSRKLHTGKRTAALGNAIVPQVAYAILKAIQDVDS